MQAHSRHWVPDVFGREGQPGRDFVTIRGKYAVTCLFQCNIRYDFRETEVLLRVLPRSLRFGLCAAQERVLKQCHGHHSVVPVSKA